uniref:Secreted protein n=1 Tax=Seriola lalandi dorsalis TaxID=1841481 RepID=A0A3B4ZBS7_SERLL
MAPFTIIDLLVAGLQLCFSRAHIDQQVQIPVQQLHGKVISLQLPAGLLLFGTLRAAVAEQQEAAGLRGAEVKGDRARLLGVPLGQGDVRLGGLESNGVQGRHVLAAEHQVTVQGDFRVALDGQA